MSDEKKTHRFIKTCWRRYGEKYTWDFDITSQADWDEVLKYIEEDDAYLKEHFDKLPKKVPFKICERITSIIDNHLVPL